MTNNSTLAEKIAEIDRLFERDSKGELTDAGYQAFVRIRKIWPELKAAVSRPAQEPVAWRYRCHDEQLVYMTSRLTDEQKARGYYRDEDDFEAEDDDNNEGPFFWSEETPLFTISGEVGKCARCGFERKEHSYNGACYGICGEFTAASAKGTSE